MIARLWFITALTSLAAIGCQSRQPATTSDYNWDQLMNLPGKEPPLEEPAPSARPSTFRMPMAETPRQPAPPMQAPVVHQNLPSTPLQSPSQHLPLRERKTKLTTSDVQSLLATLGYYRAKVDGASGPTTLGAIKRFQSEHGLAADGVVGSKTTERLIEAVNLHYSKKYADRGG